MVKNKPGYLRGSYGIEGEAVYGEERELELNAWANRITDEEARRGYNKLAWPKQYGGRDIGLWEQVLLSEMRMYYGVPQGNWAGLRLLAPSLLVYGTEEQKAEFLPKIASGETWFMQAWSEPNAGSDLASLTTKA